MDHKEASDAPQISPEMRTELEKLIANAEAESAPAEDQSSANPTHVLALLAPRNPYRIEVNDQVAIYRRPIPSPFGMTCLILMITFGLILPSAFLMLIGFGAVSFPGETPDITSFGTRVITLICTAGFTLLAFNIFLSRGPQELRVSRTQGTYTFREAKGIPRRIVERSGPCSEMAGISIRSVKGSAVGAQTAFSILLEWNDSKLKPMTLAQIQDYPSIGWGHAVALQAQATQDLDLPVIPGPLGTNT